MPAILEHVDAIARRLQRDVLFIRFDLDIMPGLNYRHWPKREALLAWLDAQQISYKMCADIGNEHAIEHYWGQIYFDQVPYEDHHPQYQQLLAHLEQDDGEMKIHGVMFCCVPLRVAMQNAHHDAPGFWEKIWDDD